MLPCKCPSCRSQLKVRSLNCEKCGTEVSGSYELPLLSRLDEDDRRFILEFVRASGSLKEMARQMELSYPTVRNILDDIILRIDQAEKNDKP